MYKHSILHSKVSVDSSLCAGTPDACTDSVFNDDQLNVGHCLTTEDLPSKNMCTEYNNACSGSSSGYVPYPGHNESDVQDHSTLTDNLTLDCDVSTTQDHALADAGENSHTLSKNTANLSCTVIAIEGEDHMDSSLSYLDSHNGATTYTDGGDTAQHLKASVEHFPNDLSLRSGYINSSQLQTQLTIDVPEYVHVPTESLASIL